MKPFKLLLLLGLLTVTGCDKEEVKDNLENKDNPTSDVARNDDNNNKDNSSSENNVEDSNDSVDDNNNASSENTEDNTNTGTEEDNTGTNTEEDNNTTEDNNNSSGDNTSTEDETSYTISFYNPSCGSFSTEVFNDRLKTYINETATGLISEIKNTKCQIGNDFPTKGNKVLIIGSSKEAGSLEFIFTGMVKKVTVTAQTYHKPYTSQGVENPNVDKDSALAVSVEGSTVTTVDLKPVDNKAIEKSFNVDVNANNFKMSTVEDVTGRVFIKEIKFVL